MPSRRGNRPAVDISGNRSYYVDGNTIRVLPRLPEEEPRKRPSVSKRTRRNRARAMNMTRGFVVFLMVISLCIVGMCVSCIQLKTTITEQTKLIASYQTTLNEIRSDNDALENSYEASMDLDTVYVIATQRLGMHYPDEDQIVYYRTDGGGYLRQYTDLEDAR